MPTKWEVRASLPTPEEKEWFDILYDDFVKWRHEEPKMPRDEILGHLLVESGVRNHLGRHQLTRVTGALAATLKTKVPT